MVEGIISIAFGILCICVIIAIICSFLMDEFDEMYFVEKIFYIFAITAVLSLFLLLVTGGVCAISYGINQL